MGINFDIESKAFSFNFLGDGEGDVIRLTEHIHQVEAFGKCFYFGYEFGDDVDGSIRSQFIKYLKFDADIQHDPDCSRFVQKAINQLNEEVDLYEYDLVVIPESSSSLNEYMVRYIYRFAQPMLRKIELIKSLPSRISFDMDGYEQQYLDAKLENGRPRYTEAQKQQVKQNIEQMMELINKKDYFTIAKDVKKSRMRAFVTDFLNFADEKDQETCSRIRSGNVLVVDDITTSGSTLNEILRTLRVLNPDNKITIFSLLGRKDLMVETGN
ncbi:MAG: phosphoribosyltransferase [Bacteroidales bacterium]|nr:phosphoribosyltransferase [Bacteroidales bacterium]